jgi:hypothetical protein
MTDTPNDSWTAAPPPDGPPPAPPRQPSRLRRRVAGAAAVSGLTVGGIAGGYVISHAATTVASPSPSPSGTAPGYGGYGMHDGGPARGALPGGRQEDLQVAADAIGISLSQLQTALQNGQTIAAVAKAHSVDVSKVISALVTSENAEVDSALEAGTITQAQADQIKAQQTQRVTDMVNGTGPRGGFGGGHGPGGLQSEDLSLVAGVIGISSSDLQTALQNGQTIAAVAKAHSVDVNTVISAWVASENKEIDDRVSSGQITKAQGDQMKTQTQQRVTDEVNGTFHGPDGRGGPGDGGVRGGAFAPPGGSGPTA